ncbi:MAG: transporter substrate-binding domain-containing protein, partial [Bacteroidota bacterium]
MRILLASILIALVCFQGICRDSWQDILRSKKGKIVFYWYPNNINIENSKDIIDGVEYDLAVAFANYLNKKYKIDLEVEWNQTSSFEEVMETVSSATGGVFGASSISITKERATYLNFTPPYLTDIAVMVSSPNVPIAQTPAELREILNGLTAVTIANTTLFQSLIDLKNEQNIEFEIKNVDNSGEVIETIGQLENGFGYIDLPNFLVTLRSSPKVRRQFFRPIKLEGLAMIYPKNSDWTVPVNDYFSSDQFQSDKHEIIVKYFGEDVTSVIDRISTSADIGPFEEIMISNREKEQQYKELIASTNREKENARFTNFLIGILGFGAFG